MRKTTVIGSALPELDNLKHGVLFFVEILRNFYDFCWVSSG